LIYKYSFSYAFNNKYIWNYNPLKEKKEYEFGGYATNYDSKTLNDIVNDTIFWKADIPPFLPPLEQSVTEVEVISKIFNSRKWTGKQTTLANFKENAHKSDILHLSLHSLLASKSSEQNAMIFQKTGANKDYILKSLDLIGLRLNNSLSVLSSCYTSDGKVISGEGMKSLARNFSLSGSPAIVASQWQAYEGQTMMVLIKFYENLKKGYSKDIALQKAQIEYLEKSKGIYLAPSNWANLILIGDTSSIDFDNESFFVSNTFLISIIIFSILMFIFSFYMFLKKEYKYWKKKSA
ncbi:MAG TPA: CHAT domain-containing protein, partial [Bacteroidetes bacterium]|nr:CHAT domain-containing protein [Bacteroidota bacterium]